MFPIYKLGNLFNFRIAVQLFMLCVIDISGMILSAFLMFIHRECEYPVGILVKSIK